MLKHKKIKIGGKYIEAISVPLLSKNLVLLRGSKGYVMCGYLDLQAAEKFDDLAIKITGVTNIEEALEARVHSCTQRAREQGIQEGSRIKDILPIIV